MKKKAIEIMRENIEIKFRHKPKINSKSKKIISDLKKKNNIGIDNIYYKLYNDFKFVNERKQMKICNSMPSFKPLLNKRIKKNVFKNNIKNINNSNSLYNKSEKQIENLIKKKLNSLAKSRSCNDIKIPNDNKFINVLKNSYDNLKSNNFNLNTNININKNKRYEYNKNNK